MSERDDIDDLLDDLAETLDALQRELPAGELAPRPRLPRRPHRSPRSRRRGRHEERDADRSGDTERPRPSDEGRDDGRRGERRRGERRRDVRRRDDRRRDHRRQPRIPSPREFLRFTEEYTIPTLIAMLEATIKSLELLRAVLRVAGGRGLPDPRGSGRSGRLGRSRGREVVSDAGRRALDSLDTVLDDLQDAIEGQPTDPRARDLLGEARDLRAEIDDMIAGRDPVGPEDDAAGTPPDGGTDAERDGGGRRSGGVTIDVGDSSGDADRTDAPADADESGTDAGVDVDAELDTIKREMGKSDDSTDADPDGAGDDPSGE